MPSRNLKLLPLLFVSLFFSAQGIAQQPESLLIGSGDMLHIQVFQTPDLEQRVRVTDSGEIQLALGGRVKVASLTPEEAAHAIEAALVKGDIMLHPQVTVTVELYATQNVTIIGEVKSGGSIAIGTPRPILDVLALAGGVTEMADRKILIERHGTHEKIPYFISNDANAAMDSSVLVYPGDMIYVPKAGIVYVLGDVGRPGGYTMTNNEAKISVLELVARAGGTNHSAVPAHAKLIRKDGDAYVQIPLPLSDMQKGKRADFSLQANDIIYVPFSYLRNFGMQSEALAASVGSAAVYRF